MTVEACLIMILTLGVIAAILYGGFYFHDRAVLSGSTYEAAVWAAHHERMGDTGAGAAAGEMAQARTKGKLWFFRNVSFTSSERGDTVQVAAAAEQPLPEIPVLQKLLSGRVWETTASMSCPAIQTEKNIRRCRAWKEKLTEYRDDK